ncbi:MAG: hypothetical protein KKD44_07155 [Proteobacteria bacterium]|nr:hypothetical protein [Pseudomonadota bacterium]
MKKHVVVSFLFLFSVFLIGCGSESDDPVTPTGPDLVVSDLSVTAWTSGTIHYAYTITNNGDEPANLDGPTDAEFDNVSVQAFLSADTVFNNEGDIAAGGTVVGLSPLGELAPGASMSGAFEASAVVNPGSTPYLVLMVDWGDVIEEAHEDNNTLAVNILDVGAPDLEVTALEVTSWTSGMIQYAYTITNNGDAPANLDGPTDAESDNVSVQAFLSADTVFNDGGDIAAGGTIVGLSPLGELAPGASISGTFGASAVVDPASTPYLVLKVDWGSVVAESDEENNALAVLIPEPGMPDLVVTSLEVTAWTDHSISYSYTITNMGDAPANLDGPTDNDSDNVSVQAYLSDDNVFNNGGDIAAGGTILGNSPLGELAPGASMSGTFGATVTVDPGTTPYLVLMVDWGGVVAESDEDNNTLAVEIDQAGTPDLVVTALDVTSWTSGGIQYSYTITNEGDGPANLDGPTDANHDNVSVQAFLSADTVFNNEGDIAAGGTVVGYSPLGDLAPGASLSGTFGSSAVVDPASTPYLVLKVDWGSVVDESNEDNNTRAVLIPEPGMPDLVVTALEVTAWTDNSISYSYTITNVGDAPANLDGPTDENYDNVSVQAFLSSDTVFNNSGDIPAGGTIVGYSPLGELAPGASMSGTFGSTVTVDSESTPYLVLMVDWGARIDESDENNNTLAATIQ